MATGSGSKSLSDQLNEAVETVQKQWNELDPKVRVGIAAVGVGLTASFLYRIVKGKKKLVLDIDTCTVEEVAHVLDEISLLQEKMKQATAVLTERVLQENMSFKRICEEIVQMNLKDPMEEHGLTTATFSKLMSKFSKRVEIREKIMNMTLPKTPERTGNITVDEIFDVHKYMLSELDVMLAKLEGTNLSKYSGRTLTMASQVYIGACVQRKFSITAAEMEDAVTKHSSALQNNKEFFDLGSKMRKCIKTLSQKGGAAEA